VDWINTAQDREQWRLVTYFGVVFSLVLTSNFLFCLSVVEVASHSVDHGTQHRETGQPSTRILKYVDTSYSGLI
jgi:hypothetical protein